MANFRIEPLRKITGGNYWSSLERKELVLIVGACISGYINRNMRKERSMTGTKVHSKSWFGMTPLGLIGFYDEVPVAWCALSPREDFVRFNRPEHINQLMTKKFGQYPVRSFPRSLESTVSRSSF